MKKRKRKKESESRKTHNSSAIKTSTTFFKQNILLQSLEEILGGWGRGKGGRVGTNPKLSSLNYTSYKVIYSKGLQATKLLDAKGTVPCNVVSNQGG